MIPDSSKWTKVASSPNAEFFELEPGVLAVVPFEGVRDDAISARASIDTQLAYLRKKNRRAAIIVFLDRLVDQDAGARTVYRTEPDPSLQVCFGLVGGTAFGRAIGSVFLGLSPPKCPTRLFGTYEEALAWARAMIKES